jgi:P-type Mg2+ transporter
VARRRRCSRLRRSQWDPCIGTVLEGLSQPEVQGAAVSLVEMPPAFFLWLVATLLAYGALTQLVKTWHIRRFHAWL